MLARDGVRVAVLSRGHDADAAQTLHDLRACGVDALHLAADVTDPAQVQAAFGAAASRFGALDILVHCASLRSHTALADMDLSHWRAVLATNLDAAFLCSQAALAHIPAAGGRIVFFSGAAAAIGVPMRAHVSAAKAGVEGLTRALAAELAARQITVNCVSPGIIDTSGAPGGLELTPAMRQFPIPAGRQGRPEEVAAVVRLLVSEDGAYTTGQVVRVNGGMVYG